MPRVALIASGTADITGDLLAARLHYLLDAGWDAHLFCKGSRWLGEEALRDPKLRERVELAAKARSESSPFDRRLRRLRPQLVHFHSAVAASKGLRRGKLREARVVISLRDDGADLNNPELRFLSRRADLLLFGHGAVLERAVTLGWPAHRAAILPAPVLGLPGDWEPPEDSAVLRMLSAGSLIWEQGFEHSIQATRVLLDSGVRCSYRIIGEGEHLPAVAFARHQLGVTEHVELVAPNGRDRLAQELARADVFVDPAVADTTSPAALEAALNSGLPAVVTRRSHGPRDGVAIVVPRRDPSAIAAALRTIASDPEPRARRTPDAQRRDRRARVEAHLSALERLYRGVLTGTR